MRKHDFFNHSSGRLYGSGSLFGSGSLYGSGSLPRSGRAGCRRQLGFTLIEIMVALLIVSIGVISIIDAINKHTAVSSQLEQRIIASWVASNRIAEIRHDAKTDRIKEGNKSKSVKMGGFKWRVRAKIKETDVEKVFLVTVEVQDENQRNENPVSLMTTAITDRL